MITINPFEIEYYTPYSYNNLVLELDCFEACIYYIVLIKEGLSYSNMYDIFVDDINIIWEERDGDIEDITFFPLSMYGEITSKYIEINITKGDFYSNRINAPYILFTDTTKIPFSSNFNSQVVYYDISEKNVYDLHPYLIIGEDCKHIFCIDSPLSIASQYKVYELNSTIIVVEKTELSKAIATFCYYATVELKDLSAFPTEHLLKQIMHQIATNFYYQNDKNDVYNGVYALNRMRDYIHGNFLNEDKIVSKKKWKQSEKDFFCWKAREICRKRRILLFSVTKHKDVIYNSEKIIDCLSKLVKYWMAFISLIMQVTKTKSVSKRNKMIDLFDEIVILEKEIVILFKNEDL